MVRLGELFHVRGHRRHQVRPQGWPGLVDRGRPHQDQPDRAAPLRHDNVDARAARWTSGEKLVLYFVNLQPGPLPIKNYNMDFAEPN